MHGGVIAHVRPWWRGHPSDREGEIRAGTTRKPDRARSIGHRVLCLWSSRPAGRHDRPAVVLQSSRRTYLCVGVVHHGSIVGDLVPTHALVARGEADHPKARTGRRGRGRTCGEIAPGSGGGGHAALLLASTDTGDGSCYFSQSTTRNSKARRGVNMKRRWMSTSESRCLVSGAAHNNPTACKTRGLSAQSMMDEDPFTRSLSSDDSACCHSYRVLCVV